LSLQDVGIINQFRLLKEKALLGLLVPAMLYISFNSAYSIHKTYVLFCGKISS